MQSLHYFPCVNVFADLLKEEILQFDSELLFKRSSFRNRMIIAGSTGPITLSIPVAGGRSVRIPYKEVEIDYNNNWQRDHFRTLCTVYGNSPFFQFYKDELLQIFKTQSPYLYDWNFNCLTWVFKKIKITPRYFEEKNQSVKLLTLFPIFEYLPNNYKVQTDRGYIYYPQVFQDKIGFLPNISILDLLFNLGPDTAQVLLNANTKLQAKTFV
jgi:hypothetical protein